MEKNASRLTASYAAVQFFFWFVFGVTVSYASPYLLDCGLSNTAIGFISAAACGLSVALQPPLAAWLDREGSPSVKTVLMGIAAGMIAFGAALYLAYGKSGWLNGALLGGAILLIQVGLPLTNALATETISQGKPLQFSVARGFGSFGYAIMSLLVGRLMAQLGVITEAYAMIAFSLCLLVSILLFPFHKAGKTAENKPQAKGGVLSFLGRYPRLAVTLAGCVLIYICHVGINNFLFQIVTPRGGTSQHMGVAMALAGVLEVLSMFFFSYLLRWRSAGFWFRVSGVFFTLKTLCTLLAPSMNVFYLVQLIQPLGWGLLTVASVYFVNDLMQPKDRIKGQAFMTMTLSVATIIGSLGGGWMIDALGVDGVLIFAAACGAAGTMIVNLSPAGKAE